MDLPPIRRVDGYLPIEDHGLLGDGTTAALVGRDGAVSWLCAPRFDSPPLFCGILDRRRGGAFTLAPEDLTGSRQRYEADSVVLVTEMRSPTGLLRMTDALTLRDGSDLGEEGRADRGELIRIATVLEGRVRLRVGVEPRGGGTLEREGAGYRLRPSDRGDLEIRLRSNRPLAGTRSRIDLSAGERLEIGLRWGSGPVSESPDEALAATLRAWRRWAERIEYDGPRADLVRRSVFTLKALDYFENGAIVAAPTSSLPESIGGPRNWDYRYAWIRDAAFSVYALHRIGLSREAGSFLRWVLQAVGREGRPRVLYDLDGGTPPEEREDPELEGYRRSRPVRWGNAAAGQRQHDVYGEIVDCAYQFAVHHGSIEAAVWDHLRDLAAAAAREWCEPDHGIWEVRTAGRTFTYSAALCQVALDRAARIAERFGLAGDVTAWRRQAERIREVILDEAWDERRQSLTQHLGGGGLDASLLSLPLRRVIDARHPRMRATTGAIATNLGAGGGLLYRYRLEESPDGVEGHEGGFLLCSFWLVDNLALQGRLEEAHELYDALCARAGSLGLLPEEIHPSSGAFLGNYPQAFSHIGLVSSGMNLARCLAGGRRR